MLCTILAALWFVLAVISCVTAIVVIDHKVYNRKINRFMPDMFVIVGVLTLFVRCIIACMYGTWDPMTLLSPF